MLKVNALLDVYRQALRDVFQIALDRRERAALK
jgi:hypothetical protein